MRNSRVPSPPAETGLIMDHHGNILERAAQPEQVPEIRIVGDLGKLQLQPTDILVVTIPESLSRADREGVMYQLQCAFPDNQCIVLDRGAKLQVVSGADDAATR